MCPVIDNPTSCKSWAIICFLLAKNMSAAEIHCELCVAVYSQNVMSEETKTIVYNVERWVGEQMFMMKTKVFSHL
jgi:hypothetical protein